MGVNACRKGITEGGDNVRKGKIHRDQWPEIVRRRATGESFAGIGRDYGCSAPAMRYIVNQFRRSILSAAGPAENAALSPPLPLYPRGPRYPKSRSTERQLAPSPELEPASNNDGLLAAQHAATDVARFLGAVDAILFDQSQKNLVALLTATEQLMFLAARIHQGVESLLGQQG
jgi:hypothetical protein